jgi:hypothetical protein
MGLETGLKSPWRQASLIVGRTAMLHYIGEIMIGAFKERDPIQNDRMTNAIISHAIKWLLQVLERRKLPVNTQAATRPLDGEQK